MRLVKGSFALVIVLVSGCAGNQNPLNLMKPVVASAPAPASIDPIVPGSPASGGTTPEGGNAPGSQTVIPVGMVPAASLGGNFLNVKEFGAKGDGVADDTAAITAAAKALMVDFRGFVTDGGSMVVNARGLYFPYGNYRISQSILFDVPVINLQSDFGARIIQTTAAPTFIFPKVVSAKISGMKFLYGTNQLVFSNNNINAAMLKIENCEFRESTDYAIKTVGITGDLHLSTMLTVVDSKFFDVAGVLDNYCDRAVIRDSWVQVSSLTLKPNSGVFLNRSGNLMLDNMTGIPAITANQPRVSGVHWVKMLGGDLLATRTRFGGEGAGYPIVSFDWDGTSGSSTGSASVYPFMGPSIVIENSWLCAGSMQTPDAAVINVNKRFPHLIRLVGNSYTVESPYVRLNNSSESEAYVASFPANRGEPRTLFTVVIGPNMGLMLPITYPQWFNDLVQK